MSVMEPGIILYLDVMAVWSLYMFRRAQLVADVVYLSISLHLPCDHSRASIYFNDVLPVQCQKEYKNHIASRVHRTLERVLAMYNKFI